MKGGDSKRGFLLVTKNKKQFDTKLFILRSRKKLVHHDFIVIVIY